MDAPHPAATIIVLRAGPTGPEVYLVKRHGRSGFMAGAHVFPGGRVDDDDHRYAAALDPAVRARAASTVDAVDDDVEAAAYALAAIRETAEECGLLLARGPEGEASPAVADEVFSRINDREAATSFFALLDERALVPDLERLAPYAWWVTPSAEPRRYDTRFFVAEAPAEQLASVDAHEVTEGDWLTPGDALSRYGAGTIALAPPTLATLEDLAALFAAEGGLLGLSGFDTVRHAVSRPLRRICPVIHTGDGLVLALPGDPLHEETEPVWPERRSRFVLGDDQRFSSVWAR